MEVAALVDGFCAALRTERQWRNVQGVLLDSFRSVGDILALQTRQLAAAERQIEALGKRQQELEGASDALASIPGDWQASVASAVDKALAEAAEKLHDHSGERVLEQAEDKLSQHLESETNRLVSELATNVTSQVEPIGTQLTALADRVKALEEMAVPGLKKRLKELQLEVEQGAEGVMVERVETELRQLDGRLSAQLALWYQEVDHKFAAKVDKNELVKLLSRKMDTLDGWKQLEEKASASRVEDVAGRLMDAIHTVQQAAGRELNELRSACSAKADAAEFEQLKSGMNDLLAVAESMQSELSTVRASLQPHKRPQPSMPRLEDAMSSDNNSLCALDLQSIASQLDTVKRQLRSELYQARYIWKSGAPSSEQTVRWDTQVLNTNSEVFTWKHGSDRIRLLVPGLYHIQASFFTNFAPTVTIRVNGEPAMRLQAASVSPAPPPASSTPPPRTPGTVQRVHHSAGTVAGLTLDGVFALPTNALVSVSYDIHERAQGLLNIRKL